MSPCRGVQRERQAPLSVLGCWPRSRFPEILFGNLRVWRGVEIGENLEIWRSGEVLKLEMLEIWPSKRLISIRQRLREREGWRRCLQTMFSFNPPRSPADGAALKMHLRIWP